MIYEGEYNEYGYYNDDMNILNNNRKKEEEEIVEKELGLIDDI